MAGPRNRVNGPHAATIGDVAQRAGVSVSSVSRYVHGEHVRTAAAIEEAIATLGFRPSHAAQTLKLGRTMTIALVVPDVTNPFFAAVVRGAETVTSQEGYTILLANTDESPDRERVVLDGMIGRVDGVLLAPASEDDENPLMLRRAGLPVVFIDRRTRTADGEPDVDTVLVDNRGGTRAAIDHLVEHGHRRIAIVSGPAESTPGRERLEAFRETLAAHGIPLPDDYVQFGGFREQGGREATERLLQLTDRPTAVFVANNVMTLGALQALLAAGVRVPEDLSIIGFDDHPFAGLLAAPLTVVDRPMEEQGRVAMHLLLNRITGQDDSAPRRIVLDTVLVERRSCAGPHSSPR
jgi:LacI family transcriptional regulator